PQGSVAMPDAADEKALAVDQELIVVDLDQRRPGRHAGQLARRPKLDAARPTGWLKQRIVGHRTNLQVVQPEIDKAWPRIDVEHQAVNVGVGEIDVALQADAEQLLLLLGEFHGTAQLQPPPSAGPLV